MADTSTRDQTLLTAGHVFAEQGFQQTTVREICARAGVNLASVNYYFGDKETLYLEAVQMAHRSLAGEIPLPAWSAEVAPQERLVDFVRTLLTRMIGGDGLPWQSRLLMREVLNPSHACGKLVEEYFRPHFELLLEILDQLLPADTELSVRQQIAFSVIGQCLFYRVSGSVVTMLVDEATRSERYGVDALAEQIARFSLLSLRQMRSDSVAADAAGSPVPTPISTQHESRQRLPS
jgi:AcrR family transcriptional regulator